MAKNRSAHPVTKVTDLTDLELQKQMVKPIRVWESDQVKIIGDLSMLVYEVTEDMLLGNGGTWVLENTHPVDVICVDEIVL